MSDGRATGVRVEGLRQTTRALEALGTEVTDLKDAMGRIAEAVKPVYVGETPRGATGALKSSWRAGKTKGKAVLRVGGGARVPYAQAQQWGWGTLHTGWKHGRHASPGLRGSFYGHNYIGRGDEKAAPRAHGLLEQELNTLITRLNLG